jgi:hypothetical protein
MLLPTQLCAASKPDIDGESQLCRTVAPLNNVSVASDVALEFIARDASRSEQGPGVEAAVASITGVLCCLAVGFLRRLLRRPNCAPGLGGALHDCKPRRPRELCVSRRAAGPPRTRSTTRGPNRSARPLLLLAACLRVSYGFDGSAGESAGLSEIRPDSKEIRPRSTQLTPLDSSDTIVVTAANRSSDTLRADSFAEWLISDTLWARYQRITVTSGDFPSTVNWSLDCEGLIDPIVGGAPYSEMKDVPPGECNLTMTDTYCDGWNGAEWSAPGWTDESYSANASELLIDATDQLVDAIDHFQPWTRQLFCTKQVSFRIVESPPLPPPWPPLPPPSPPSPPLLPLPTAPPLLPPKASQLHRVQGLHIDVTDNLAFIKGGSLRLSPALKILLPLCMLLVATLLLLYWRYSRLAQNEANLRASRDRAHFDLQLIAHRVQGCPNDDDLSSQPGSLLGRRCVSFACATADSPRAHSLPPGPPSSSAESICSAEAASLPHDLPSNSANQPTVPHASPAGHAYLEANPAHQAHRSTSHRSTSHPTGSLAPLTTSTARVSALRRGMDVTFGHRPVAPKGPAAPAKILLKESLKSLWRCTWKRNLALRWESLTDSERETHMLEAANNRARAANHEPPPPAPFPAAAPAPFPAAAPAPFPAAAPAPFPAAAPAPFPAATPWIELIGLSYAGGGWKWPLRADNAACGMQYAAASTAPPTSVPEAGSGEYPGLPLTATVGSTVRLVDLMDVVELQDDQAFTSLTNHMFDKLISKVERFSEPGSATSS